VSGRRPRLLLDGWVDRRAQGELEALVPGALSGGWDLMTATWWKWAWGGAPFAIGAEASYQAITGTGFRGFGVGPISALGF
jgi:hypothetical protein